MKLDRKTAISCDKMRSLAGWIKLGDVRRYKIRVSNED